LTTDNNCLRKYGDEMYLLRVSIILCLYNKRNPSSCVWGDTLVVKGTDCMHTSNYHMITTTTVLFRHLGKRNTLLKHIQIVKQSKLIK